jgi:hypothetical protein
MSERKHDLVRGAPKGEGLWCSGPKSKAAGDFLLGIVGHYRCLRLAKKAE